MRSGNASHLFSTKLYLNQWSYVSYGTLEINLNGIQMKRKLSSQAAMYTQYTQHIKGESRPYLPQIPPSSCTMLYPCPRYLLLARQSSKDCYQSISLLLHLPLDEPVHSRLKSIWSNQNISSLKWVYGIMPSIIYEKICVKYLMMFWCKTAVT